MLGMREDVLQTRLKTASAASGNSIVPNNAPSLLQKEGVVVVLGWHLILEAPIPVASLEVLVATRSIVESRSVEDCTLM